VTDAEAAAGAAPPRGEMGILVRGYRAFELLFSVHARLARREAGDDLRRIATGVALAVLALGLVSFALIPGQAAAVLAVERRFQWGYPASIGAVAGADVFLALVLLLIARARLSAPVLPETRAMVKKAAAVLRG
jgi:hypothetical protein